MQSFPIADAQDRLPELLELVAGGEEVVITREDRPIARLTATRWQPNLAARVHIEAPPVERALHPLYPDDHPLEAMLAQ